jgi:hypothetical protein
MLAILSFTRWLNDELVASAITATRPVFSDLFAELIASCQPSFAPKAQFWRVNIFVIAHKLNR